MIYPITINPTVIQVMFTNLAIPKRGALWWFLEKNVSLPGRLPQFQPDRELLWQPQAMGPVDATEVIVQDHLSHFFVSREPRKHILFVLIWSRGIATNIPEGHLQLKSVWRNHWWHRVIRHSCLGPSLNYLALGFSSFATSHCMCAIPYLHNPT